MGIIVIVSSQEDNNAMVTTTKSWPMISPITDSARKNARKAAEVVRDALSSGKLNSFVEAMAGDTDVRIVLGQDSVHTAGNTLLGKALPDLKEHFEKP